MTITSLRKKVEALNIEDIAVASLEETKDQIAKKNVEQMQAGKTKSFFIVPPYAASTIKRKIAKGQPWNRVTLRDTGQFQNQVFALVDDKSVIIGSEDFKSQFLEDKYGDVFGLNRDFKAEYVRESLRPTWQRRIADLTGLKFS